MDILSFEIIEKAVWAGIAALGFGLLFNIPKQVIFTVFVLGFLAGVMKFISLDFGYSVITATFFASLFVGIVSIPFAYKVNKPIVVFSIPSIIPMIPGFYAYKTILGIMKFTFVKTTNSDHELLLNSIFSNGFMVLFILFAITVGVSAPMLLLGKDMARKLKD